MTFGIDAAYTTVEYKSERNESEVASLDDKSLSRLFQLAMKGNTRAQTKLVLNYARKTKRFCQEPENAGRPEALLMLGSHSRHFEFKLF